MWFTSFIRIFRVVLLFNYQASLKRSRLSVVRLSCATTIYILARFLDVVNTFFKFFLFSASSRLPTVFAEKISFRKSKLVSVTNELAVHNTVWINLLCNGEGGIWTLAPLLTTYSLSRGAPSASWVLLQADLTHNIVLVLLFSRLHLPEKNCTVSKWLRAIITERVGFEPTRPCGQTVFKTASLWPLRYLSTYLFVTSVFPNAAWQV